MVDAPHLRMRASGIVLAGGRSTRFGGDKLKATIDGRPILERAVEAVAGVCDEVLVALPYEGGPVGLPKGVVMVRDAEPDGGPLVGVLSAAPLAGHERLLVVGGDMPSLVATVLRRLLETLDHQHQAVALGLGPEVRPQPLPLAVCRTALMVLAAAAKPGPAQPRSRSLHSVFERLDTSVIPETAWRRLDPDGASLRDVDAREDLAAD